MPEHKAPFLDVGTVAGMLRMHPNTVRDNLVPLLEWEQGSSAIPALKIGGRRLIPRWWVEEVIRLGSVPPRTENPEDSLRVQNRPKGGQAR